MARKYGKKNEIKIDPLAYNIGLIGESGIGKSTLIKEVCEKLAGEDGYLALDVGKECGHDAIHGIVTESVPDWDKFEEVVDDIVENKFTDYKELRVVVIDTIDQLFDIVEPCVIKMHNRRNRQNPDKMVDSIKAAFGGFQEGEKKAIELVLDKIWELRNVGVSVIVIGHTKKRDIEDVMTNKTYSTLTTNMTQKYFSAIRQKLHFLGVAYVDREIIQRKTGKKNIVTKQEEIKGKIVSESRRISFRDDNYNIDSKSRFADVAVDIPLDADAFIQVLEDAIATEHAKGGKDIEISRKEQAKQAAEKEADIQAMIEQKHAIAEEDSRKRVLIESIKDTITEASPDVKTEVREIMAEHNFTSFRDTHIPIEALEKIAQLLAG